MNTEFNIELTSEEKHRLKFLINKGITPMPIHIHEDKMFMVREKLLASGFTQKTDANKEKFAKDIQELLEKYKIDISDTVFINTSKDGVLTIIADIIHMGD